MDKETRALRSLINTRDKLVKLRSSLKNKIHNTKIAEIQTEQVGAAVYAVFLRQELTAEAGSSLRFIEKFAYLNLAPLQKLFRLKI